MLDVHTAIAAPGEQMMETSVRKFFERYESVPPPMKWSDSKYGFAIEEDCNGEEETQAGRDRCEVAAG
jgi:hypothetical protein